MKIFNCDYLALGLDKQAEYRRTYNLSDRDNVRIFILPKGQAKKLKGSFLFRNMSSSANRLHAEIYGIKRKIREIECTDDPDKLKKITRLRGLLEYTACKLNAEMSSLPLSGFIVDEENE